MNGKTLAAKKTYNVAVVGATGAVGLEMIRMLEVRKFPVKSLRLFASERSNGKRLIFNNNELSVETLVAADVQDLDIAIFSAGASISKQYAPLFAKKGV